MRILANMTRPAGIRADDLPLKMKIGDTTKARIRLRSGDGRWLLVVDDTPVITTSDRRWLRRFAVKLRQTLSRKAA
jgi:hypothetical protein